MISEAVLEFWFGPRGARGKARPEWFRKDEKFDAEIRRRFGELHASAALRELEAFEVTRGLTEWAERHRAIIRRFGRFPHRNAALGRTSTPAEAEFLEQPGSGF